MQADKYAILLAHLLDDEISEEQGLQLLALLEEDPSKLQEVARHLELWELYSQTVCSQRSGERFMDSWQTRVAAVEDADRFVTNVEMRLAADIQSDQERIQEIERRAQRELRKFLAEDKPSPSSGYSYPRVQWDARERVESGLEKLYSTMCTAFNVVKVLAVCIAVALAISTIIQYVQAKRVVATLHDSVSAKWTTAPEQPQLRRGWLELQEGFAQLDFKSGATTILQAPCRLRLESPGSLFLEDGVLTVKVTEPKQDFRVHTHNGTVTDLGTEFGVIADEKGRLETHVYQGRVQLSQGPQGRSSVPIKLLERGQAAGVDGEGHIVSKVFEAKRFTRSLPETVPFGMPGKRLDLSDVLVGGSGFGTGDPNQMVQLTTGTVSDIDYDSANRPIEGARGYMAPTLPGVDFLFIPDGGTGPVQVSSDGHTFNTCPDTCGMGFDYVSNRGMVRHIPGVIATAVLNGRMYGTRANPVIAMHANAGITFDLQAIRAMQQGIRVARFTALCGLSETSGIAMLGGSGHGALRYADFWVLVDGQERFQWQGLHVQSGGVLVRVDLNDQDQFLTLMVTDGGDKNAFDWGLFALPALELE